MTGPGFTRRKSGIESPYYKPLCSANTYKSCLVWHSGFFFFSRISDLRRIPSVDIQTTYPTNIKATHSETTHVTTLQTQKQKVTVPQKPLCFLPFLHPWGESWAQVPTVWPASFISVLFENGTMWDVFICFCLLLPCMTFVTSLCCTWL